MFHKLYIIFSNPNTTKFNDTMIISLLFLLPVSFLADQTSCSQTTLMIVSDKYRILISFPLKKNLSPRYRYRRIPRTRVQSFPSCTCGESPIFSNPVGKAFVIFLSTSFICLSPYTGCQVCSGETPFRRLLFVVWY